MNYEIIKNKHIFLDTNILINYSKFQKFYQYFFDKLKENNVTSVINKFVMFEILRFAKNLEEKKQIENFFKILNLPLGETTLPIVDQNYDDAINISNIYQNKLPSSSKISPIDCFISAELLTYNIHHQESKLFLATENHQDFPTLLFDRVGIETIDTNSDGNSSIHNIGIYSFNVERFNQLNRNI